MKAFFGQSDIRKSSDGEVPIVPSGGATTAQGENLRSSSQEGLPSSSEVQRRSLETTPDQPKASEIPKIASGSDVLNSLNQTSSLTRIGSSGSLTNVIGSDEIEILDETPRKLSGDSRDDNDEDDFIIDTEVKREDHSDEPIVPRFDRTGRQSFSEDDGEYVNECALCQCKTYDVSPSLSIKLNRSHFFCKVMAVKSVQLAVIIGWIIFQEVISFRGFRIDVLVGKYHDAVFVAIGFFIVFQILIRIYVCQKRRPLPLSLVIAGTFITTIGAAFICGSDISKYRTRQKILHELVITLFAVCTCLTFLPLTNAKNIDVTKAKSFGSAAFATLIFSVLIMFVVGILEQGKIMLDFKTLPESWIPVVLTAEFIIMILILEIKLALHGKLCNLTEHDWLFLAMLL